MLHPEMTKTWLDFEKKMILLTEQRREAMFKKNEENAQQIERDRIFYEEGENPMPLVKSKSKEAIGQNIKEEEKTKPKKQAIAIALNVAREAGAKIKKPKK